MFFSVFGIQHCRYTSTKTVCSMPEVGHYNRVFWHLIYFKKKKKKKKKKLDAYLLYCMTEINKFDA